MITIIWLKQGREAHEYSEIRDQQFSYFGRIPQKVSKRVEGRILCGFCVYNVVDENVDLQSQKINYILNTQDSSTYTYYIISYIYSFRNHSKSNEK